MEFSKNLYKWYKYKNISLPWRGEKDLYKIWLSEVMLQQTQVKTVIPYYNKWIDRFPTIESVSNACEDEVLKYWEGLGYYSRVRNFQSACKTIQNKHNGKIPTEVNDFLKLKGVGKYICAAVLSIGLNKKIPVIDGNVKRVVSRFLNLKNEINKEVNNIFSFLSREISVFAKPGDFNQAIMDLGRLICKPKNPNCNQCPLKKNCISLKKDMVLEIPNKNRKAKKPHYKTIVTVIEKNNKILLCKRNKKGLLGGMWELLNGRIKSNETQKNALQRILSYYGFKIDSEYFIGTLKHQYSHFSIEQKSYQCLYKSGNLTSDEHSEYKWISYDEKNNYPIHIASHKILNKMKEKKL